MCVGVDVCAGLAGQPNGAWMLVAVSGVGASPGPDTVCVGRTLTSVRSKKFMEKLLYVFLIIMPFVVCLLSSLSNKRQEKRGSSFSKRT